MRFSVGRKISSQINQRMVTQTVFDSGSITPLTAVLHRFPEPGRYYATVNQGEAACASFVLIVDKGTPATPSTINLGEIAPIYTVSSETYVAFNAPRGSGGYSVVVEKSVGGGRSVVFDSRMLGEGDIFVVTLLRPGNYSASNQYGAKCEVSAVRATEGLAKQLSGTRRLALRSKAGGRGLECNKDAFNPSKVSVEAAQPLVFSIKAPMRIKVVLESQEKPSGTSRSLVKVGRNRLTKKPG